MADTSDDYFSDKDYLPPGSPYLQSVLVNWGKGKKRGLSDELCSDDELDLVGAPFANRSNCCQHKSYLPTKGLRY